MTLRVSGFLVSVVLTCLIGSAQSLAQNAYISNANPQEAAELQDLLHKISAANITKFHIVSLRSGTQFGGVAVKKILVWNNAGRQLYPSLEAAAHDGFTIWEFDPDSQVAQLLDKQLKPDAIPYSDNLLLIFWVGLLNEKNP